MKIFSAGMKYAAHNKELDHTLTIPDEPVIFMKPGSALRKHGNPIFIPSFP